MTVSDATPKRSEHKLDADVGSLISVLTTVGWFVRLPDEALRLTHSATIDRYGLGIFIDVAGIAATPYNAW